MQSLRKFHTSSAHFHLNLAKKYARTIRGVKKRMHQSSDEDKKETYRIIINHLLPELHHHRELAKRHRNLIALSGK